MIFESTTLMLIVLMVCITVLVVVAFKDVRYQKVMSKLAEMESKQKILGSEVSKLKWRLDRK